MMTNIEQRFSNLEKKIEQIIHNFNSLQALILYVNEDTERKIGTFDKKEKLWRLTVNVNEGMERFRNARPPECKLVDFCTGRVEKSTTQILQDFRRKGEAEALRTVERHLNAVEKELGQASRQNDICDERCFNKITKIFKNLREIIKNSNMSRKKISSSLDISSPEKWDNKYGEVELYDLLTPLSHVSRLKILRTLAKGGKSFSSLERGSGIKANLQFHLEKLIRAKYVKKQKHQGKWKYMIDLNGLKALKLLTNLKSEINQNYIE